MSATPLKVVLNRWAAVDSDGNPRGVCAMDPTITRGARIYIGASVAQHKIVKEPTPGENMLLPHGKRVSPAFGQTYGPGTFRNQGAIERFDFVYEDGAVTIDNTSYHRSLVRQGALFAADEATYKAVFSTLKGFRSWEELLIEAEDAACGKAKQGRTDG